VVGASSHDNNGTDRGRAYIFYGGGALGATISSADVTLESETVDSTFFGNFVSTAGDVNADGYGDISVGAYAHPNGGSARGRVYFFLGGAEDSAPAFSAVGKATISSCIGLESMSALWTGLSTVNAGTNNMFMEVFRYGSTNAWEDVKSVTSCTAGNDCTMDSTAVTAWVPDAGVGQFGEYCDANRDAYWRVYQASGLQTFSSDAWTVTLVNTVWQFGLNSPGTVVSFERAAYTVTRQDYDGNPLPKSATQTVYIFSDSGNTNAFYDAANGGSTITQVTIASNQSSANFWYYDEGTGSMNFEVSDDSPKDGDTGINDALDTIIVTPPRRPYYIPLKTHTLARFETLH